MRSPISKISARGAGLVSPGRQSPYGGASGRRRNRRHRPGLRGILGPGDPPLESAKGHCGDP